MKIKLPAFMLAVSIALTYQSLFSMADAQVPKGNNPLDDLFDRRKEGLFIGGGVAYGTTNVTVISDEYKIVDENEKALLGGGTSGYMRWRIGYATSKYLAFYITSDFTNLQPQLGVMHFSEDYPAGYYTHVLIGYSSADAAVGSLSYEPGSKASNNTLSFAGGIGYEFRPHFMIEFTLGYSQHTLTATYYAYRGPIDANFTLRQTTFFASFNYLFY